MIKKISGIIKKNYYFLTSFLMFLSFPSFDISLLNGFAFFAWISLVPLFIFIRNRGYKDIYIYTFITGLAGNYFIYKWIGAFGAKVAGGDLIVLLFLIPCLSIFFTSKIIVAEYLSRNFENLRFLIFPMIWICFDLIQSVGFLAFPLTYWGYSQYQFTTFIQISSFTGIMGITFILILSNNLLADLIHQKMKNNFNIRGLTQTLQFKKLSIFIIVLALILCFGKYTLIHNKKSQKKDLCVAMVQSCISPWENWKSNRFQYLQYLDYYTSQSLLENPDMVIWSESATLESISYHYNNGNLNLFERKVLDIARLSKKPLLTGEIGIFEDTINDKFSPQNNASFINEDGEVVQYYSKIKLVPFGEWFPYEKWFPLIKKITVEFGGSDFIPGKDPVLFEILEKKFGVLICYEGIFFRLCRKYKSLGADFFINITNDGWTDTYSGHMQVFTVSIFRAIENGIWYVRAGNTGYTTIIDPYGRITKSIPILKKGYLVGNIDFSLNHETFYSKYGDIFLYISISVIALMLINILWKTIFNSINKTIPPPD